MSDAPSGLSFTPPRQDRNYSSVLKMEAIPSSEMPESNWEGSTLFLWWLNQNTTGEHETPCRRTGRTAVVLCTQLAAALRLFRALNHKDGSEDTQPRTVESWSAPQALDSYDQEYQHSPYNSSYKILLQLKHQRKNLLQKLIVAQLVTNLSTFSGAWMFTILSIGTSHRSISWSRLIQFTSSDSLSRF